MKQHLKEYQGNKRFFQKEKMIVNSLGKLQCTVDIVIMFSVFFVGP